MFVTISTKTVNVMKDKMIFTNKTAFTQAGMENTVVYTIVYYSIRQYKKEAFLEKTQILVVCSISFSLALNLGFFLLNSFPVSRKKLCTWAY